MHVISDSGLPSPGNPDAYSVPSGGRARGVISPPPSKSVSHRLLNLAFLSGRPITLAHLLDAEDVRHFRAALSAAGYSLREEAATTEGGEAVVHLRPGPPPSRPVTLFCGAAGTMARFLVASCAAAPAGEGGTWVVDGGRRLRERPLGPLLGALRQLGARLEEGGEPGCLPVRVRGASLRGGRAELDAGESSQYLSALLMAALLARQESEIRVQALTSEPYVAITLEAIRAFGGRVSRPEPSLYRVRPGLHPPSRLRVEGDYSAACYPAAAAALTGGLVRLRGLARDSAQGDRRFLDLLAAMGARVEWEGGEGGEWVVEGPGAGRGLRAPGKVDLAAMPDQVPTLAALAPFARGETWITGVGHLRLKESDRLAALSRELTRVGAEVRELSDGLRISGTWAEAAPASFPVITDSHDDHRIAMSLALVGLRRPGIAVGEPSVVGKSYPRFWKDLEVLLRPGR